ncbi:MAG TPA: DegQ family serine endoprotease [Alphaproteobacteria bacterium]|nr:DegQ family serine endoprotease [Alphaproteobacteria bacterium]
MGVGAGWSRFGAARSAALLLAFVVVAAAGSPAFGKTVPLSREQITFSFAPVVKKVAPAVVNIYTRTVVEQPTSPLFADPFFRRFFGEGFMGGVPQRRIQNSLGSGVIIGADGTIVTNYHVIKGADQITVVLPDRREFEAKVVGSDERADIAVLRIDSGGAKLPVLEFGDSDAVEVGDLVIAIGNPFGVGQTVTSGIISALARTTVGINDYDFFIQTDAAINPGNSGGPLVTMDGKLIGVNTAIYSQSGGSIGIGFAIPSNMVRMEVTSILAGGRLVRPWLGAQGQTVTADIASSLGLQRPSGVLVNDIYKDSPAANAGLRPGDVILDIDNRPVDDAESLRYRIATKPLNTTAVLTVYRQGRQLHLPIALTAPPETVPRDTTKLGGDFPLSGAVVANLSPAVAEELGIDSFLRGVVVTSVRPGSPASRIGVKAGDVILRINGTNMKSVETLKEIIAKRAASWQLTFRRGDRTLNLVVND